MTRQIDAYVHLTSFVPETPDTAPGDYLVSAKDGNKWFWLLSGPYINDHASAIADIPHVRRFAEQHDPRAHFMRWGTCRYAPNSGNVGTLQKNKLLPIPAGKPIAHTLFPKIRVKIKPAYRRKR